jgi:cobaltochelatase CobN
VRRPARPTIGVCFYRSHSLTGNTAFVDALCAAIEAAGGNALAVWSYSLRRDRDGRVPALELLDGAVDALIDDDARDRAGRAPPTSGTREALAALDVPVIQAVCATRSRAAWLASDSGLSPLDAATQVAIPEFDGRLLGGVISFKERREDRLAGARYVPDASAARGSRGWPSPRALRAGGGAARRDPAHELPDQARAVGMAVGLDTPASALELLRGARRRRTTSPTATRSCTR